MAREMLIFSTSIFRFDDVCAHMAIINVKDPSWRPRGTRIFDFLLFLLMIRHQRQGIFSLCF